MLRYAWPVTINRPPAEVFPYLTDPKKQALYSDVPMRQITPGVLATGSRMEVTFGMGPIKAKVGLEMTVDENSRMAFTTFSGPIRWQGEYLLKPTSDGGTNLSHEGTMVFTGLWRLLEPLVGAELKSGGAKEMERMKAAIEAA
ncbi:MAG: SRPBCC family protein [Candidatus Limnocylindrales bacterium]